MWSPSRQTASATMAMIYVTIGALTVVWSCIWYVYLTRLEAVSDSAFLWCYGFLLSGLVLVCLGLFVGRIGRAARHAEVAAPGVQTPPPSNTGTTVRATTITPSGAAVTNTRNP